MATPRDIDFIKSKDVVEESLFLDLVQFEERPVIESIIKTVAQQKQKLYDEAVNLAASFLLDVAQGTQLDLIGEELGIPRLGQDDTTYRVFLQLTSYKSKSVGTRPEIIDIVSRIVGGSLDEILTYSGINKSIDVSLFLACYDSKTTVEELIETFPLVSNHRVIDRFGRGFVFNSELRPRPQQPNTGFTSVFDEIPSFNRGGGSRIGTLISASDSFNQAFPYVGVADRYKPTYASFGTSKILTRDFDNGFFQLRRSSDNTTVIVGAINFNINQQTIEDFDDGSTLYMVRWYNQSGDFDFYQPNNSLQPTFNPSDNSLTFDLVNDELSSSSFTPYEAGALIVNTVYGNVLSVQDINSTMKVPPFLKTKGLVVVERPLKLGEYNSYVRLANTPKKLFIGVTTDSTIFHNVTTTRTDGNYQIDFYGGNGNSFSTNLNNTISNLSSNGLTGPYEITIPFEAALDISLSIFDISGNNLIGFFPDISYVTGLSSFNIANNQIEGSVSKLHRLTSLASIDIRNNKISGYTSHIEDGVLPINPSLGVFNAQNNLLTQKAVDTLLADFVQGGRTSEDGLCELTLDGTGNSAPSSQGITNKNILITRGWTVLTN